MRSFRKSVPALVGLLFAGIMVAGGVTPAGAQPFTGGSQGTALVGGSPLVQANCPTVTGASANGGSTAGTVSVGSSSGAQCNGLSARAAGEYGLNSTPPAGLRFEATCESTGGSTGGFVDVPAGTNVAGVGVVGAQTVVTQSTTVTYPGGTTAAVNQVSTTPTSVTRTAILITSGPGAGTVIGRAVCGAVPYPLTVDAPAGAASDLALTSNGEGGSDSRVLLVGGAIALLVLAQVGVGRSMWRRRRSATGS